MTIDMPAHVPAALVHEFDHHRGPGTAIDPFAAFETLRKRRVFWSPVFGGFWMITSYADIRAVLHDAATFSSSQSAIPPTGWTRPLVPTELDPPEHGKYRTLLARWLAGSTAKAINASVAAACLEIVEGIASDGSCDLVAQFSRPLQNALFTALFAVPANQADLCATWVADLLQHDAGARRSQAVTHITGYLDERLAACESRTSEHAGEGLLETLARADLDGDPLTRQQKIDLAFLLAVASLDTLAQSINFSFRYLAEHPQHQHRLANEPAVADRAADELLRLHSVVSVARTATRDTQLAGVSIREGDRVLLCLSLAGRDPAVSGATADFDRPGRHLAFGAGPHRCLGARIARQALATALREWHRRIPAYGISERVPLTTRGGAVCSLTALPLTWPT